MGKISRKVTNEILGSRLVTTCSICQRQTKNYKIELNKIYAVGIGPGSPNYITGAVKEIIVNSDIVVGYKYTLKIIENLLSGKEVFEISMKTQEEVYQKISKNLGEKKLVVPFTGDVNFSESEVVDRLIEIFGDVQIIPGVSVKVLKSQTPTKVTSGARSAGDICECVVSIVAE